MIDLQLMVNFLNINTKSLLKRNKSLRGSLPYKEAMKVGIVFTVEDKQKHEQIKELIKKLEQDNKKVNVICFLPRDKQNYEFLFDFFTEKDVSFWGNLTSQNALKFSDISFDYLYYLDTEPNSLILNLLARSKAKCRMGSFWEEGSNFLEFMIENKNGTKGLIDGLHKYSSLLK